MVFFSCVFLCSILWLQYGVIASAHSASLAGERSQGHFHYNHAPMRYLGNAAINAKLPCESPTAVNRCFLPQDFYAVYNILPLIKNAITGQGRTIVIIDAGQSPTLRHDLALFDKNFGLKNPTLNIIAPFGLGKYDPDSAAEITLDVETAHAIAPEATIALALAPTLSFNDIFKITQYAINKNLGDVISQSFGAAEQCTGTFVQQEHRLFAEATNKRITVFASSGDNGSAAQDCKTGLLTVQGVQYPASDPLVTAVGGTTLYADKESRYSGETTWNESRFGQPAVNNAAGGGFSTIFSTPDYQKEVSSITSHRGVPDIAYDADADKSAALIVCSSCGFGPDAFVNAGGTSAGAPQWAGIIALANQSAGERVGFINEKIYTISKERTLHDVVLGNNTYAYTSEQGRNVTVPGYSAAKTWDPVTGWGSPNVAKLLPALLDK